MSVKTRALEVHCDEPGCPAVYEQDDLNDVSTSGEARYFAICAGWQRPTRNGVRRDYCPKHKKIVPFK